MTPIFNQQFEQWTLEMKNKVVTVMFSKIYV